MRFLQCAPVIILTASVLLGSAPAASARIWTTKGGEYQLEADEIGSNEQSVILKKKNGDLLIVALEDLSDEDRAYVQSKETQDKLGVSADQTQTWTSKEGLKVRGRVLEYGRREIQIYRRVGRAFVNDRRFSSLDDLHQLVLMKIVAHLEGTSFETPNDFERWTRQLGAQQRNYTVEGVLLELDTGDVVGVPFFLFSDADLKVLEPGWQRWLNYADDQQQREAESFMLRTAAQAYQQNQFAHAQMEMLKIDLLAASTGAVGIWQVTMVPRAGVAAVPMQVLVPAQSSLAASQVAMQRYPGYVAAGASRASR